MKIIIGYVKKKIVYPIQIRDLYDIISNYMTD